MMVKVWEQDIIIPTYEIGSPEKNPMFLEKRIYQGSSGVVYPYPIIEKIFDHKVDKNYRALFIENEYLLIIVLPDLGGRVYRAYDKIKQRDFIYYNKVIKPALVGLTGPWISGGIEFNWPQHHRPSTFLPVDYNIKNNEDGSCSIWINEVEIMFHTKGMIEFRLYPGKAYLEMNVQLYNRTAFPQSFLWWANIAVHANDFYQSIFPPDVHAVFDHGKRDVSSFPIATGKYYHVDYSPGTDISWYKNIPVPTSYMAVESKFDFLAGFQHDVKAGIVSIADYHIAPGKKQWTWGNGDFGHTWDKNLTDSDGPYVEIMTGIYTENQPDFSWIFPEETKVFKQYLYPYHTVGIFKNATKNGLVDLELNNDSLIIKVFTTSKFKNSLICLIEDNSIIWSTKVNLSPEFAFEQIIHKSVNTSSQYSVIVYDESGNEIVKYTSLNSNHKSLPLPAEPAPQPDEIQQNEVLYLNGLHLEQYRHPTYNPLPYYLEAIKRDEKDARSNIALGLWYLRNGKFQNSVSYFKSAIERLTLRNPNPYDGEAFFHLGTAYRFLGELDHAYDAFYKSTWNYAWQSPGYLELARIACIRNDFNLALEHINQSLWRNNLSSRCRHLKVMILRKTHKLDEALKEAEESIALDPFNMGCYFEKLLIFKCLNDVSDYQKELDQFRTVMRKSPHNYLEYAWDYINAGYYHDAILLLEDYIDQSLEEYIPLIYYTIAWCYSNLNKNPEEFKYLKLAESSPRDYVFPNRNEDILVLQHAIKKLEKAPSAYYFLGNLWYDKKQYEDAIYCWEKSIFFDPLFPTSHRNLSIAYFNKLKDFNKAREYMERAFALNENDSRVFMELDQIYKILGISPDVRLANLNKHKQLVSYRDDLYLEWVTLLNNFGKFQNALDAILSHRFHPWEGGEGKVTAQYLQACLHISIKHICNSQFDDAIKILSSLDALPEQLGEEKLRNDFDSLIYFLMGITYKRLGNKDKSIHCFNKAAEGESEPKQALFYNDPLPEKMFYQGMALLQLSNFTLAKEFFNKLINYGKEHLNDKVTLDYFAVSYPDLSVFEQDFSFKNHIHCLYLCSLGNLGNRNYQSSLDLLNEIISLSPYHQGVILHKLIFSDLQGWIEESYQVI